MKLKRNLKVGDYFYLNAEYEKYSLDLPAPCKVISIRKDEPRTQYSFFGSGYFGHTDLWTPDSCMDIEKTNQLIVAHDFKKRIKPMLPEL